jgi:hypothetical protein
LWQSVSAATTTAAAAAPIALVIYAGWISLPVAHPGIEGSARCHIYSAWVVWSWVAVFIDHDYTFPGGRSDLFVLLS